MKQTILIGGKAGQGINKTSQIISELLASYGYYTFNYRDYQSLIRGGHNFNILSFSDETINSSETKIDTLIALDEKTIAEHKSKLKRDGKIISFKDFEKDNLGRNLNIVLAGVYLSWVNFPGKDFSEKIRKEFGEETSKLAIKFFKENVNAPIFKKINKTVIIKSGASAISDSAIQSGLNFYVAYPMTPSTSLLDNLASKQNKNFEVFQGESEISCISMALGASFAGKVSMTGTSGGGFDLMSESLSMQGQSEIPLCVYLASRPGPGTGVPTYTAQSDLDIALRAGHGEFPRVVVAPGDSLEAIKITNELLYTSYKYNVLEILLGDKHFAESEFSFSPRSIKYLPVKFNRDLPGKKIVKASSYEQNSEQNTTEDPEITKKNFDKRMKKYEEIKEEIERKFEMVKFYGRAGSKNLVVGWGSTKGAIIDAIKNLDAKFMQVVYLKPLSKMIKKEMQKADNIILVENNQTGQLGRLLREATGISIKEKNRILKYDGRPFWTEELRKEIKKRGVGELR